MKNDQSTASPLPPSHKPYLPWLVWGLGCLFYFYEIIVRTSPSVMGPELMRDFAISATTFGFLTSFYHVTYTFAQIPAGLLLDKMGPHRLLTFSCVLCAAGSVLFGWSEHLALASTARLLIGLGSAFAAIGTMRLAANWFPAARFTLLTGLMVSFGSLGGVFGEAPLALSVNAYGWRSTMVWLGIAGLLLTLLIYGLVRDEPQNTTFASGKDSNIQEMSAIVRDLIINAKNPQFWLTAIYGGLIFGPFIVFVDNWGTPLIMAKYAMAKPAAALLVSMGYVGLIIGGPIGGYLSDTIKLRKPNLIIAALGTLLTITGILYAPMSVTLMYIAIFLFGFFTAWFLPAFSIIREISPQHSTATALGFMNMMNMIFIIFLVPAIGYMLDSVHTGMMQDGSPLYTLANHELAMSLLPIAIFLGMLALPFIKETHCEVRDEHNHV